MYHSLQYHKIPNDYSCFLKISLGWLDTRCHVPCHQETAVPRPQSFQEVIIAEGFNISRALHRLAENPDMVGDAVTFE